MSREIYITINKEIFLDGYYGDSVMFDILDSLNLTKDNSCGITLENLPLIQSEIKFAEARFEKKKKKLFAIFHRLTSIEDLEYYSNLIEEEENLIQQCRRGKAACELWETILFQNEGIDSLTVEVSY